MAIIPDKLTHFSPDKEWPSGNWALKKEPKNDLYLWTFWRKETRSSKWLCHYFLVMRETGKKRDDVILKLKLEKPLTREQARKTSIYRFFPEHRILIE